MASKNDLFSSPRTTSLEERIDKLIVALDRATPRKRVLIARSFLTGIFGALGATIGLSLIFGLLTFILSQLQVVPFIHNLVPQSQIEQLLPRDGKSQ